MSTPKDKIGNYHSDALADLGVASINGQGLVRLGRWIANRHDNYIKLIARIHRMSAAVTVAEKRMREHNHTVEKLLLGYDPKLWPYNEV